MAREAQGWRHFHQEGYKGKSFAASSAVTGFASSAFGSGFVLGFVCGASAASQKEMKCLLLSFAFKTGLSFVCKYKSKTQALTGRV